MPRPWASAEGVAKTDLSASQRAGKTIRKSMRKGKLYGKLCGNGEIWKEHSLLLLSLG